MSDETTPGPDLRKQIGEAIRDEATRRTIPPAWPAGPGGFGATMQEMADAVLAVVQPELDRRDAEIRRHREVLDFVTDAGIKHQFQRDQLKAAMDRVREALAGWLRITRAKPGDSPELRLQRQTTKDICRTLEAALDQPSDLPAVRAFPAENDPRGESTEIHVVKSGFVVADDGGWVPGVYPTKKAARRAAWNMRDHGTPEDKPEEPPCPMT